MIKYKTSGYTEFIEKIEVDSETKHSVFIGRFNYRKRSSHSNFFDTFDEAKEFLLKEAEEEVEKFENRLKIAKEKLEELRRVFTIFLA